MDHISRSRCLWGALGLLFLVRCGGQAVERVGACAVSVGDSPARGPDNAWVTAVEFGDFQCPYCGAVEPTLDEVDAARPGVVRWVWKHMPLSFHAHAMPAAIAAECARAQGLFWPMHDALFAHQSALDDASLSTYASGVGVDLERWQACLGTEAPRDRIAADEQAAAQAGVNGTPTFFFNGELVVGAESLATFLDAVDRASSKAKASGLAATDYYAALSGAGCP